jgi:hypothetical protein
MPGFTLRFKRVFVQIADKLNSAVHLCHVIRAAITTVKIA